MSYYEFKRQTQTCSHCHWAGPGSEANVLETFAELAEYACPRCGEKVAVVMHPTIAESRAEWSNLDPAERSYVELIEAGQREFAARSLKNPDQLPTIDLPFFTLLWDHDGWDHDGKEKADSDTVILLGSRVIWLEPCCYEGYWRFEEVADILRKRYGSALQDLEPTRRSELYLYGDKLSASRTVTHIRNALRAAAVPPLPPLTN